MTFIGRIKQHSAIWHRWRGEARVGGILHGVHFAWEPGNVYRTLPLTKAQITALHVHDNVVLEVVSVDTTPAAVAVVAEPVAPPASKPAYVNSRPAPGRRS
jgi:hypothetical protein